MATNGDATKSATEGEEAVTPTDLSAAVGAARRGFRRDTEPLIAELDRGALYIPLSKPVAEAPLGERIEPDELTLSPHLVETEDDDAFAVAFTREDALAEFATEIGWTTTDEGDLQYCTLPARAAFDLALQLITQNECAALIINPSADDELMLRPHELESLRQGQPLPLVGYVEALPVGDEEPTLVSELDEPPAPEFIEALERCVSGLEGVSGYRLQQTFNRERDLEPHPTLILLTTSDEDPDTEALEQLFSTELEDKLPAPGYIDVVFERG